MSIELVDDPAYALQVPSHPIFLRCKCRVAMWIGCTSDHWVFFVPFRWKHLVVRGHKSYLSFMYDLIIDRALLAVDCGRSEFCSYRCHCISCFLGLCLKAEMYEFLAIIATMNRQYRISYYTYWYWTFLKLAKCIIWFWIAICLILQTKTCFYAGITVTLG